MDNSTGAQPSIFVSDCQEVTWSPWSACLYADSLAVFRFSVTDTVRAYSLQPDEVQRANRYHRPTDRNRFMYGRHLLRVLLAQYTGQLPHEITFTFSKNRKPELANTADWYFNVSHSGDWVLVVIARQPVGVDVETSQSAFTVEAVLSTSFTAVERQFIQAAIDPLTTFYRLWTRKEALVKATGKGLDDDFPTIPSLVGLHQLDSRVLGAIGNWLVQSFAVANDYTAAVAYPIELEMPKFYTIEGGFFNRFTS